MIFTLLFFFNDTATTEIYTLSLHDALPIWTLPTGSVDPNFGRRVRNRRQLNSLQNTWRRLDRKSGSAGMPRPISYAVFCLKKKKKENPETRMHTKWM